MSKIDTSSWKKFKISDLFTAETGDVDLQQKDVNGKGVALVSSGESNTGVIGLTDVPAKVIPGNTITVDMFGIVQYRDFEYKMVTHARVFALVPKEPISQETGLFLTTLLQKLTGCFSYNNMCSWNKIKDFEISLPVTAVEQPDWDYMQERIAELEQERIAELGQYLVATGLNDYTLTDEDLKTLSLSGFRGNKAGNLPAVAGPRKEMREFRMGDLFEKPNLKWRGEHAFNKKQDLSVEWTPEFNLPLCNAKNGNNGIMYYGRSSDFMSVPGGLDIVNDGAVSTGNVYPQPHEIGVLYNAYVVTLKDGMWSRKLLEYLACVVEKTIKYQFGYDNKATWDKVKPIGIQLPIQTDANGQPVIDKAKTYHPDGFVPDWDYMAAYIRAIEKLVIKDVVDFKDACIAGTMAVTSRKEAFSA